MKERGIIFSGPMVLALLAGTKTQTRRLVKAKLLTSNRRPTEAQKARSRRVAPEKLAEFTATLLKHCPYGVPGRRLWVRETFAVLTGAGRRVVYRATDPEPRQLYYPDEPIAMYWAPSIHMERWASRITLEITEVRVQRLQEISEEDAIAEGITGPHHVGYPAYLVPGDSKPRYSSAIAAFESAWDMTNGKRATWDSNPWVFALTFKRVEGAEVTA